MDKTFLDSYMLYSALNDHFWLFATSAIAGVLARETIIFLVPVWFLAKDRRKGALLTVIAVVILFIPRYILKSDTSFSESIVNGFNSFGVLQNPVHFANRVINVWGFVWLLAIIGIWLIQKDKFLTLATSFLLLLCGAFLSSLIATDTGRMFSILTPVFAISCAQVFDMILKIKKSFILFLILVSLIITNFIISLPNIFFGPGSLVFTKAPKILFVFGLVFILYIGFRYRDLLHHEITKKLVDLRFRIKSVERHCP